MQLYPFVIAVGLGLWVGSTLATKNEVLSIALRVLAAVGFGVAALEAAGVIK